jgi:flagellar hook-associated protein 3 FlgL
MRVSDKMAFDQVNKNVTQNRTELNQLQNQAATQKRVTKPSDDPVAASRVLFARTDLRGNEQYVKNLNYARGFLDYTEQSLNELTEVMMRAKELALSQANDASSNAQSRKIVASELQQLHDQAIQIGNRKLGERFIFGGFKTTASPFDLKGDYRGDEGEMKIHIDKDSFLAMNLPGSLIFEGKGLSKDGITFKSEQQAKTLEEWRNQKATKLDKNARELEGSQNPRAAGNDAQMRGPASLTINNNTAPQANGMNSRESSSSVSAGAEGHNLFKSLKRLEISLMANDKTGIQESLDRLDDSMQQVVLARTSLGSRVMTIDSAINSLAANQIDTKSNISQLEDADAFEVVSDINKNESALQATLQTSGRMIQKSLMDFIS